MYNLNDLSDLIVDQYVVGLDGKDNVEIMSKLPMLVLNDLASEYSEVYDFYYSLNCSYPIACKMIQKFDKKLKKYRRKIQKYEIGGEESNYADKLKESGNLAGYNLNNGTYIAAIDDENYMILEVKDHENKDDHAWGDIDFFLYFVGYDHRKWMKKFMEKVDKIEELVKKDESDKIYYTDGGYVDTNFKPIDFLIMKNKDTVLRYIDNWVKNIPTFYDKYNIIPKLSIMIYGVPGTGKSTFAKSIAKYLNIKNITSVGPDYFRREEEGRSRSKGLSKKGTAYNPTIYTLDDIDCICKSRDIDDSKENNAVLSSLLAYLDNPPTFYFKANNGKKYPVSIVIATTNYYDKLDAAVKRFGRFDLTFEMKDLDLEDAKKMCELYSLRIEDIVPDWKKADFRISPSKLQAICIDNIDKSLKQIG